MEIKLRPESISHLSVLIPFIQRTYGSVVELGIGIGSTPVLHELCRGRKLISYENNKEIYWMFRRFKSDWHEIVLINSWEEAVLERPWALAFVDQAPALSRKDTIMRLKPWADYMIVHDTEKRVNRFYGMRALFPKFSHFKMVRSIVPHTTILSDKYEIKL